MAAATLDNRKARTVLHDPETVERILALVDRAPASPALLAIDGHSAAGKSTLARAVAQARAGAAIVPTDDFYRPRDPDARAALDAAGGYAAYYDWQRLEAQVLRPLRAGVAAAYQRYDWATNSLGAWAEVAPAGLVIVEGCTSARPELRAYYDAIVLVATAPAERDHRQKIRADATQDWLDRWDAAERWYMQHERPERYADLVISGS